MDSISNFNKIVTFCVPLIVWKALIQDELKINPKCNSSEYMEMVPTSRAWNRKGSMFVKHLDFQMD